MVWQTYRRKKDISIGVAECLEKAISIIRRVENSFSFKRQNIL
jgi:hypothetical protein